jgi:hypothetical protein
LGCFSKFAHRTNQAGGKPKLLLIDRQMLKKCLTPGKEAAHRKLRFFLATHLPGPPASGPAAPEIL